MPDCELFKGCFVDFINASRLHACPRKSAMRSQRLVRNQQSAWTPKQFEAGQNSLVFYFGTRQALAGGARNHELRALFPAAHILGCSTGGQIDNDDIGDDEIIAAAIDFAAT